MTLMLWRRVLLLAISESRLGYEMSDYNKARSLEERILRTERPGFRKDCLYRY